MKKILMIPLLLMTSLLVFAEEATIDFHLPCKADNECLEKTYEGKTLKLDKTPRLSLTKANIVSATIEQSENTPSAIIITMNSEDSKIFSDLTEEAINSFITVIVNEDVVLNSKVVSRLDLKSIHIEATQGKIPFWQTTNWEKKPTPQNNSDTTLRSEKKQGPLGNKYVGYAFTAIIVLIILAIALSKRGEDA